MMPPVFASSDIATLVADFPPPTPTKQQPSLLASASANSLLNSQRILSRFRVLLDTRYPAGRIKVQDLPSLLGLKGSDWLFECFDGPIQFSRDKQSIITSLEFDEISKDLRLSTNDAFVELSSFASERDVSIDSLHDLISNELEFERFPVPTDPQTVYISSP